MIVELLRGVTRLVAHGRILSLSLSRLVTFCLLRLLAQKFVQRFPLISGIPGFPYYTNKLAHSLSSLELSLFRLSEVDLGLFPLQLLWSDPSPSVDTKDAPRLNEFLALTPFGGLTTPTREPTHRKTKWVGGRHLALAHLRQRGPHHTIACTGF